jgi:hypothetical protein
MTIKKHDLTTVAYKKHISLTKTSIGLEGKGGKDIRRKQTPEIGRSNYTHI